MILSFDFWISQQFVTIFRHMSTFQKATMYMYISLKAIELYMFITVLQKLPSV